MAAKRRVENNMFAAEKYTTEWNDRQDNEGGTATETL
jgi:hypothetical protein